VKRERDEEANSRGGNREVAASPNRAGIVTASAPGPAKLPGREDGMATPEEAWRIERVLEGDRTAFAALYDEHLPRLWRLATTLCGERAGAETLTRAVLRHAFRSLATSPAELPFGEWLEVLAQGMAAARPAGIPEHRAAHAASP
jgi:hypothetical protein